MLDTLTIAQAEAQVREFVAEFTTPNTLALVEHCEAGRISWFQAYDLACKALAAGMGATS